MFDFFRIIPPERKVKIRSKDGLIYRNPPVFNKIVFALSNVIFVVTVAYLIYLYLPLGTAYWRYKNYQEKPPVAEVAEPILLEEPIKEFRVEVPKILAEAEVVENVPIYDKEEYLKILDQGKVAQAKGSDLPGDGRGKTIYLFAHSSQQGTEMARKNAVFYLLGELMENDEIDIFRNGEKFVYRVYKKGIFRADDLSVINYRENDKEVLILQTCWPIGTDWKRLVVFAKKGE